jgi:hypothetical protein
MEGHRPHGHHAGRPSTTSTSEGIDIMIDTPTSNKRTSKAMIPEWIEIARSEHLIDEFLRDSAKMGRLLEGLSVLPSDKSRLLYLRICKKIGLDPDEPQFYYGVATSIFVAESLHEPMDSFLERLNASQEGAANMLRDLNENISRVRRQAERIEQVAEDYHGRVEQGFQIVAQAAAALPNDFRDRILALIDEIKTSTASDAKVTVAKALDDSIGEASGVLIGKINAASKMVMDCAPQLEVFGDTVRKLQPMNKIVIGKFEIEKWKLNWFLMAIVPAMVLSALLGTFVFQRPVPVTIGPVVVREINAGYDFLHIYDGSMTPSAPVGAACRADIDRSLKTLHNMPGYGKMP